MMFVTMETEHSVDRMQRELAELERSIRALQAKRRWLKRELKLRVATRHPPLQEVAA